MANDEGSQNERPKRRCRRLLGHRYVFLSLSYLLFFYLQFFSHSNDDGWPLLGFFYYHYNHSCRQQYLDAASLYLSHQGHHHHLSMTTKGLEDDNQQAATCIKGPKRRFRRLGPRFLFFFVMSLMFFIRF
jgi:hypothetical protein